MNTLIKNTGIKFGCIIALFMVLTYLIIYFLDYKLMNSIYGGFLMLFVIIVFGALATFIAKRKLGGYITLKEAFIPYFITISIGLLISTIFLFVLYGVVDKETGNLLKLDSIELTKQQMLKFGVPKDQAEQSVVMVTESNPYSFGTLLMSAASRILLLSVPGLIIAMAIRNKSELSTPTNQ